MSRRNLPEWAERFDRWGKRDLRNSRRELREKKKGVGEYIFSIIVNAALVIAAHKLPDWAFTNPWLQVDAYKSMLWTLDLSFLTHIAGNFMLIFYRPRYIRRLASLMFNIVSIVFLSTFLKVFPVNVLPGFEVPVIGLPINSIIKIAAIIGLVGSGIAAIVNLIRLIVASIKSGFEDDEQDLEIDKELKG